eukprot:jgi/Undpi1/13124/HiC_scaffold_8.g02786.m1
MEKSTAYYLPLSVGDGDRRPAKQASGAGSNVLESSTSRLALAGERVLRWESGVVRGGGETEARAPAGGVPMVEAVRNAGSAEGKGVDASRDQRKNLRCRGENCGAEYHDRGAYVSGKPKHEFGLETARQGDLGLRGQAGELRAVNTDNNARAERSGVTIYRRFLRTVNVRRNETLPSANAATAFAETEREDDNGDGPLPPLKHSESEHSGEVGAARVEHIKHSLRASKNAFPGSNGGEGLRGVQRRTADDAETSPHDELDEGDDEAVDGFGSVGLLAFVVCFGVLFCVMEVAKCYLLLECRRRQQLRRRREEDTGNREGQMPLADSRPVAPTVPPAGSKEDWVEVVVDGVSIGSKLPVDKNAKDVPSARGYAVADASHALQEAVSQRTVELQPLTFNPARMVLFTQIEHAERLSPGRGSRVVFTVPPPPRSSLLRSSPNAGGPVPLAPPQRALPAPSSAPGPGEGQGREG